MNIVVGRCALVREGLCDKTNDVDVWTSNERDVALKGEDISVMPEEILELFEEDSKSIGIATLNDCYTIKLSHLVYDIFWWKHAQDVLLLQDKGAIINHPLYEKLIEFWEDVHRGSKSHLSLYRSKDEFFDDFVPKQHEHDYLHELVAFPDVPVYTTCLKEGQEVLVDKERFDSLPYHLQIRMFKEEIAVIAMERWIVPSQGKVSICHAWNRALHKTVVSLTKGWASRFIVENLMEFIVPLESDMERTLSTLNIKEKDMTLNEFIEMVNEALIEDEDDVEWGVYEILFGEFDNTSRVEFLEQEGGGEGGAEDCYSVIRVDDKFYLINYNYYSYMGFEYDYASVSVVTPKQKTITVYE